MFNNEPIFTGTGGGKQVAPLIEIFYEALTELIGNSELIAGQGYKIIDFQSIYDRPDYTTEGSVKYGEIETITSPVYEPLICFAVSSNELYSKVMSTLHPKDSLQYDVRYTTTEVNSSPAKGRITERIDDKNNRTDYDHRYIFFKRYEDGEGNFVSYKDTGLAFQLKSTFTEDSVNNFLGNYAYLFDGTEDYPFKLSNNVFAGLSQNNTIGTQSYNNHFQSDFAQNTIETEFAQNVSYGAFINNKIGHACGSNAFTGLVYENNLATGFSNNDIAPLFRWNKISKIFANCITGEGFSKTTIDVNLFDVDFTTATKVYENNCTIYDDATSGSSLYYYDNQVQIFTPITA